MAKAIISADKTLGEAELKAQIAEITSSLAQMSRALTEANQEIETLKSQLAFKELLVSVKGFKYEADENGDPVGYAYCPTFESMGRGFARLVDTMRSKEFECPECGANQGWKPKPFPYPDAE
ncbi:MAG: hypothetical protein ABJG95_16260 [Rhizobiaceae bacterium]